MAEDAKVRAVIEAARVWRIARYSKISGGTFHHACKALDEAVAALIGELDREPTPSPTADDLEHGRAVVEAARRYRERLRAGEG